MMCSIKERVLCRLRVMDPTYALEIYTKEWQWILEHADKIHIVAIYSWNEYHERSEIEPHIDAAKPKDLEYDPYIITKNFVHQLEKLWYSEKIS